VVILSWKTECQKTGVEEDESVVGKRSIGGGRFGGVAGGGE
jgi:hypothetical protein